ncbi:hypothetical protein NMY22_g7492 [Coprinellus aureogranulatus]|nr:hypothetical protein NMY22_g7492 [Coprinellus aureogranulatus]
MRPDFCRPALADFRSPSLFLAQIRPSFSVKLPFTLGVPKSGRPLLLRLSEDWESVIERIFDSYQRRSLGATAWLGFQGHVARSICSYSLVRQDYISGSLLHRGTHRHPNELLSSCWNCPSSSSPPAPQSSEDAMPTDQCEMSGSGYAYVQSGENGMGNHWCRYVGTQGGVNAYHYYNANGSYYQKNTDGSAYFDNGRGYIWVETSSPSGEKFRTRVWLVPEYQFLSQEDLVAYNSAMYASMGRHLDAYALSLYNSFH